MASLITMLDADKINAAHTEKLYFGRFSYRIEIDTRELRKQSRKKISELEPYGLDKIDTDAKLIALEREIIKGKFVTRRESYGFKRYYIASEEDAIAWFGKIKPLVTKVNCPLNETQKDLLLNDEKTVIRKYNFWGRYPWRITFNWTNPQHRAAVTEWFIRNFNQSQEVMGERAMLSFYPMRIHLADERDVFVVKCRYSNEINKIEKVVIAGETS